MGNNFRNVESIYSKDTFKYSLAHHSRDLQLTPRPKWNQYRPHTDLYVQKWATKMWNFKPYPWILEKIKNAEPSPQLRLSCSVLSNYFFLANNSYSNKWNQQSEESNTGWDKKLKPESNVVSKRVKILKFPVMYSCFNHKIKKILSIIFINFQPDDISDMFAR